MASPSRPINIKSPKGPSPSDLEGDSSSHRSFVGTPNNRTSLRATPYIGTPPVPNIPPRNSVAGTPLRAGSPATATPGFPASLIDRQNAGTPGSLRPFSGSPNPNIDFESLTEEDKARVLRKHLVSKDERGRYEISSSVDAPAIGLDTERSGPQSRRSSDGAAGPSSPQLQRQGTDQFPIPFSAPGADVTHDIYKWHADRRRQVQGRTRAISFHAPEPTADPAFEHIHEPGGFRRNYMKLRANEQGTEEPPMLDNFIDFLTLFGHFAGEELEDEEDEPKSDDEEAGAADHQAGASGERTPLLRSSSMSRTRSRSRRRRGDSVGPNGGTATVTQAVLMLLKSFIGTGVLFLGKAFFNGGLLFSSVTFVCIAAISLYSFLLLLKAKFAVNGSFGDIGGALYGPWMRYLILSSIVLSQIGFVAAYTIFVAENLQAFVLGVTNCLKLVPIQYFIFAQVIVFLPLALVRDIAKLGSTALIADVFIFAGLAYIFGSEFKFIANRGIADVKLFNAKDFPLFIGTAVFSFEGIGLVIPISDAMKEPHKFPMALSAVMAFLTVLFGGAGALAYLTFGSDIQTVVLVNLDMHSKMVQTVQFFYAIAIMLSVPLQLFPAVRILENGLFTRSGKQDPKVKWHKNIFRFGMVALCTMISWAGAGDLDKFVAFVGCFACVPLCYVYPAMLHYRAVARTRRQKLADLVMIVFGLLVAAYTTVQTIKLMLAPTPGGGPVGTCEV